MNLHLRSRFLCAAMLALAVPVSALADDLYPPPWRPLDPTAPLTPHSVLAKWDLLQFQGPPLIPTTFETGPEAPYRLDPNTPPLLTEISNQNPLVYRVDLPNFIDPLPIKLIRVQYSWFAGDPSGNPSFPGDAQTLTLVGTDQGNQIPGVNVFSSPTTVFSDPNDPLLNLAHRYDDFIIEPNPDFEFFDIAFFNGDPRWIVIDTISVPEPTTFLLLGLAGIVLFVARRRT